MKRFLFVRQVGKKPRVSRVGDDKEMLKAFEEDGVIDKVWEAAERSSRVKREIFPYRSYIKYLSLHYINVWFLSGCGNSCTLAKVFKLSFNCEKFQSSKTQ